MDLRSFKLHLVDRRARAVIADARGTRGADLPADAFAEVAAVAAALVIAVEQRAGGPIRALSVDLVARVIRLSVAAGPTRGLVLAGPDFAALAPLLQAPARAIVLAIHPRRTLPAGSPSDAAFWDEIYRRGRDGWELARPAPPLARWFASHPPTGRRILVPGCGRGHEARLVARDAAQVVAIDFASDGIRDAHALAAREALTIDFRAADLFALPAQPERFDLIVEHCCFCAIDPARRAEYVGAMADLLVARGTLVGLFWSHGRAGGPPFTVARDELLSLFGARFELLHLETPVDSVATRAGDELLAHFQVRTAPCLPGS
ncbi:MAG: methyltransferase domain-containing protein [Myxococcales bacterium]|nr:methyltransferase domain-containing protein [Myxococcales bacterium]